MSFLPSVASPAADAPAMLARARWATRMQFFALGACAGTWGAHVPTVKAHYGLTDASLSLVLFAMASGAVLSLLLAGRLVARFGPARVALGAVLGMGTLLSLALVWPLFPLLLAGSALYGACFSVLDVAINAEGSELESRSGRAIMSNLHAMFSIGGMTGAGIAGALLRTDLAAVLQLPLVCGLVCSVAMVFTRDMLPSHHQEAGAESASFAWPHGRLLTLGLLVFAAMTAEGVMYDWSVLYMKQELRLPQSTAALGYAVFSAAVAATRFAGDALRARYDESTLLRVGGLTAALAMAAVLLSAQPWVAFIGYALVGAGVALTAPMLFNAATRVPGVSRAAAIASVTSVGYTGFMLGPPLIGTLATATSLTAALWVLVLAALALGIGAGA